MAVVVTLIIASGMLVAVAMFPISLRVGAVCLYVTGALIYLELRSLLSRGYSLRILTDLYGRHGESASLTDLQTTYGNGVGLRGMLQKRLSTLARLRLVTIGSGEAGSLTPLGRLCAMAGLQMRRLLRMPSVG